VQTGSQDASLRTYYLLVATQLVSQLGSRISVFAVAIALFAKTAHATPIAIIAFCQTLPWILGAGFAGAVVDRYDRRRLLILANIGFVLTSGLLLASLASGAFQLWQLYALTLITAAILTVSGPAFSASIAVLVPDSHRDRANAIGQMTGPAANAMAPALAGLLYAVIGVTGAIAIDIATFGVAILALLAVRIPMPAKTAEGAAMAGVGRARAVWRQAFDGWAYLWRRPSLLGLCLVVSNVAFLMGALGVLILPYPLARTHSTLAFGVVLACAEAGTITGAASMAAWGGTRPRIHTVMPALIAAGLLLAVAGTARTTPQLALSFFAFMFMLPFVNTASASIFQAKVAPDVQGRVFAAIGQIGWLTMPLAFLIAGPLTDRMAEPAVRSPAWRAVAWLVGAEAGAGMGLLLVIGGLATAVLSLAAYAVPALRRLEASLPDHSDIPPARQPLAPEPAPKGVGASRPPGAGRWAVGPRPIVKDYGVRRLYGPLPVSAASVAVVVAAMVAFKTQEVSAEHQHVVAEAKAWTIAGPPCPSIGAIADIPYAVHPLETFSFQGVRFSRAYGYVSCRDVRERQGRGPGMITVCQFNSPTVLQVVTPQGRAVWLTGVHNASVSVTAGVPRCVLSARLDLG
jgi:DHA3 family macrolide efflux protein-like MFS transporter